MANMHVLTQYGGKFRIALHIAIPAGNNAAGVPWRTALVRSGLGLATRLPDGDGTAGTISAPEKADVAAGNVLELEDEVDVTRGGTLTSNAQLGAFLDAWYAARSAEVLDRLQAQLAQYGRNR